ncbi:MAG: Xaa-Pro aminopeptidase [Bacteroidetes bacterium MedPE-SWsnd-G1]|nr:MAG: Xaa-Pro aminopeptidase [Bacteroidetes bacterium MedPE-SWsnd-G1]
MKKFSICFFIVICNQIVAQNSYVPITLNMEKRAQVIDTWLEERVDVVLPKIMNRSGIDMWLIIAREYNEDPVIKTLLPATWQSARRTTILIVYNPGEGKGLQTFGLNRYDTGSIFKTVWDKDVEPNQWQALADLISEKNPNKIGINKSETFGLADGLSSTHYDKLLEVLPEKYHTRLVNAEELALGWLETRTDSEMMVYGNIVRMAHQIIAEGFSEKVIQPGVTTTNNVEWWYRDRIRELGFTTWFHPSVSIQRSNSDKGKFDPSKSPDESLILPGDLVHVDFGINYLRLNTDTQQHVYILKSGEREAPDFLKKALKTGNRLQDILTSNFKLGSTGNDILKASLEQCKKESIRGLIYTHPIGYHGHGGGPAIGMWDQQNGVPGKGDYELHKNTAYSIELNASVYIEEWNKDIRIMLEEDAFFNGEEVFYIDGRQTELMTIPRMLSHNN